MAQLKRLRLAGWKSIKDQKLEFGPINVLVGANGAGKSNLVSFFHLLNEMFAKKPGFREYIATHGKASSLLHFGPKTTPSLECDLTFDAPNGESYYHARWGFGQDQLVFLDESVGFHKPGIPDPKIDTLGIGHSESNVPKAVLDGDPTAKVLLGMLQRCRVFHFHDTSETAGIRTSCFVHEWKFLKPDASNLAAMLFRFQEHDKAAYSRIREAARQMIPGFADFVLEPDISDSKRIELRWHADNSKHEFTAYQLSDGSIRFIALATLLLQPADSLPSLIVLDEPELGLHPAALRLLGDMVRAVAGECQVLLATQSPLLLDEFEPEEVVVVDNKANVSTFRRLSNESALEEWLKEYTLSELWERNCVGGGPYG